MLRSTWHEVVRDSAGVVAAVRAALDAGCTTVHLDARPAWGRRAGVGPQTWTVVRPASLESTGPTGGGDCAGTQRPDG